MSPEKKPKKKLSSVAASGRAAEKRVAKGEALKLLAGLIRTLERRQILVKETSKDFEELQRIGIITVVGELALLGRLTERCNTALSLLERIAESTDDGEAGRGLEALDRALSDVEWEPLETIKDDLKSKTQQQAEMFRPLGERVTKWQRVIESAKEALNRGLKARAPVITEHWEVTRVGEVVIQADRANRENHFHLLNEKLKQLPEDSVIETVVEGIRKKTEETQAIAGQADILVLRSPLDPERGFDYTLLLRTASEPGLHGINIQGSYTLVQDDRTQISETIQDVTKAIDSGLKHDSTLRKSPPLLSSASPQHGAVSVASQELRRLRKSEETVEAVQPIQVGKLAERLQEMGGLMYRLCLPNWLKRYLKDTKCSVMITTNDLELPWELMYYEHEFLCLQRPVSRMPMGREVPMFRKAKSDKKSGPLKFLLIYADPKGSLPAAKVEIDMLHKSLEAKWAERIDVVALDRNDATGRRLNREFGNGEFDVIHYAGHARFDTHTPKDSCLLVSDQNGKEERYTAEKIEMVLGGRPLVFLNACQSGYIQNEGTDYILEPAQGLASAFLDGGALACVGSLWPIYDKPAAEFALEFYRYVLEGYMLGEAMRLARIEIKKNYPAQVTWAAFTLYGDATFRLDD